MVEELAAVVCFLVVVAAEVLHAMRCRRLRQLAFAGGRPSPWVHAAPLVRAAACGMMCWGLMVLLRAGGGSDSGEDLEVDSTEIDHCQHVVVILDVSPSMQIEDAGATGVQKRAHRAVDVMASILERVVREDVRYSLVAVYTDARPVIVASIDTGVLKNIMELPLEQAFDHGKTQLLKGVECAFELAGEWAPASTTFILLTDGDTVDTRKEGFPAYPRSLAQFLVAGLGTRRGAFIDGHQSRQDSATLQFMASRFNGYYHDVNVQHIPTAAMGVLAGADQQSGGPGWTRKQLAVAACGVGGFLLAGMPVMLELFGFNLAKQLGTQRQLPARSRA